jgi:hypothetical protein
MPMAAPAVAYIIYNRPRVTEVTFARLRQQRPARLFIIADGPRNDRPGDAAACAEVRDIVSRIEWPCDVTRDYSDRNMGCRARVSSGLNNVFSHVDAAVVLEDDCVPAPDFFAYAGELLQRYMADERVAHVSGGQYWAGRPRRDGSYYFSKYPHIWGWATWARAWRHYDDAMTFWPALRTSERWRRLMPASAERRHWTRLLDRAYAGRIDSWGYPWIAAVWHQGGMTATPWVNLVRNVGVGSDATHTVDPDPSAGLPVQPLGPMVHPMDVVWDDVGDAGEFHHSTWGRELKERRSAGGLIRRAARRMTQSTARLTRPLKRGEDG